MTNTQFSNIYNLYKKFVLHDKEFFLQRANRSFGVIKKNSSSDLIKIYEMYSRPTFYTFCNNLRNVFYADNIADLKETKLDDLYYLHSYLYFLTKTGLIDVSPRSGKVKKRNKAIAQLLIPPYSYEQVKYILERKLKKNIQNDALVLDLFSDQINIEVKTDFDQLPISQSSAILLVHKMLNYLSINDNFLFVGDDDLISVLITLVEPRIKAVVVDADKNILNNINKLANDFHLPITTYYSDVRKKWQTNKRFSGFLLNPPYTFLGAKKFIKFGLDHLSNLGGTVFLVFGDESIGNNRFLLLQKFCQQNNLNLLELLNKRIFYPFLLIFPDDKLIISEFEKILTPKILEKYPQLSASLFIFNYIPWQVKDMKISGGSIYAYI